MKSKKTVSFESKLVNIELIHNLLSIKYIGKYPKGIEKIFVHEDNLKNFPPNGIFEPSDLDHFYYILLKDQVVGFYRVIDLFFSDTVELHGGFNKYESFIVRSYFELTKKFVSCILSSFPEKKICTVVHVENISYLNFIRLKRSEESSNYVVYYKPCDVKIKIIESYSNCNIINTDSFIYLKENYKLDEFHDNCFFVNETKSFFDRFIKITNYFEINGKLKSVSIYRKVLSQNRFLSLGKIQKNELGLLIGDIKQLKVTNHDNANIKISQNLESYCAFYLFHPNLKLRISICVVLFGLVFAMLVIFFIPLTQ
jgi:hypothetical protein